LPEPQPTPQTSSDSSREGPKRPSKASRAPPKVIDASGLVLGRAASLIAQRLLLGEEIVIINADRAVVVGSRESVLSRFKEYRARGSVRKGPFYPRRPDRIFRRTVRGMLPYHHQRGRDAFKRVMTYVGLPPEFAQFPRESLKGAEPRPSLKPPMTLGEISHLLGSEGPW
jgi:large subunit ribosomal protein L13